MLRRVSKDGISRVFGLGLGSFYLNIYLNIGIIVVDASFLISCFFSYASAIR